MGGRVLTAGQDLSFRKFLRAGFRQMLKFKRETLPNSPCMLKGLIEFSVFFSVVVMLIIIYRPCAVLFIPAVLRFYYWIWRDEKERYGDDNGDR